MTALVKHELRLDGHVGSKTWEPRNQSPVPPRAPHELVTTPSLQVGPEPKAILPCLHAHPSLPKTPSLLAAAAVIRRPPPI